MSKLWLRLCLLVVGLMVMSAANAVDVTLRFDPVTGATGYKIERGTCASATWTGTYLDIGNVTTYVYSDIPEGEFAIFRVGAYNDSIDLSLRAYSGAWYDHRLFPIGTPGSTGIE